MIYFVVGYGSNNFVRVLTFCDCMSDVVRFVHSCKNDEIEYFNVYKEMDLEDE